MPVDSMVIDLTAQLAPAFWGVIALLLATAGFIAASIDRDLAEVYLGDRRLLVAALAVAALTAAILLLTAPGIAGETSFVR
jgi:hypothetical protein